MEELSIQMLGGFSLRIGNRELSDTDNRSKKVWVLLAYLICQREHCVLQGDPAQLMLAHRDGKQILSLDQKPVPAGIRNGDRLILI